MTQPIRRSLAAVLGLTLALGLTGALGASAVPATGRAMSQTATTQVRPAVPALDWRPCGDGFRCAQAPVPLDYDEPDGAQIGLALIKLPASGARPAKGTVFINPGGPGGSGVGFVRNAGKDLFTADVRRRFDIVGFDPRGIARSRPVECFETQQEALDVLTPFPFPYTQAQERRWLRADREYAQACAGNAGPIINHMSTANVARDIDVLRAAVGDRRTTFVGYSYGSMVGSTYAAMFPDRVRAVVIDSVIDPVSWATGRGDEAETLPVDARLRSEDGAYATLQQFLTLCDDGGDRCAFSAGDPRRRYQRIAHRLIDEPVQLPGGGRVTYNSLVSTTLGAMYGPDAWPALARLLHTLSLESQPAQVARRLRAVHHAVAEAGAGIGRPLRAGRAQVLEGFAGVTCSDTDNPANGPAWAKAAARGDRRSPYFGRAWIWGSSICAVWPGADEDRFTGPFSARTASPVLVVGTRFDPATRYEDAVSTASILGRARLLTLEGWGHTTLFVSPCVDRYTADYLLHVTLPPRGASCRPAEVPFAAPSG